MTGESHRTQKPVRSLVLAHHARKVTIGFGKAEVADVDVGTLPNEHVFRLDVAMPECFFVHVGQRRCCVTELPSEWMSE